ncbi:putative Protein of unknown function (DUF410) [Monocercomonoides exilis]|uniref:putative Protein of unknown function (DUF410) n=1 Tax=Monocercomonoides exilis TaxID=2049356 RepID=UPI003559E605|nr:putative Protein of unknown function (DUF410) [Monocercomonoides exilis]|eukprot:MONOS_7106.1-p1 / transcript=MONOS_7106.1 / gene=MONOS_7106 / organism=Monocercomonoides_exilis_PA203 / gene_product=unspecified product / transcript_product=unspecified product / location=Mono_scaffold00236:32654-34055(+) / protein_length=447 / sequence_SO=supercontig / SO=protein_coding / is_pseudo=false
MSNPSKLIEEGSYYEAYQLYVSQMKRMFPKKPEEAIDLAAKSVEVLSQIPQFALAYDYAEIFITMLYKKKIGFSERTLNRILEIGRILIDLSSKEDNKDCESNNQLDQFHISDANNSSEKLKKDQKLCFRERTITFLHNSLEWSIQTKICQVGHPSIHTLLGELHSSCPDEVNLAYQHYLHSDTSFILYYFIKDQLYPTDEEIDSLEDTEQKIHQENPLQEQDFTPTQSTLGKTKKDKMKEIFAPFEYGIVRAILTILSVNNAMDAKATLKMAVSLMKTYVEDIISGEEIELVSGEEEEKELEEEKSKETNSSSHAQSSLHADEVSFKGFKITQKPIISFVNCESFTPITRCCACFLDSLQSHNYSLFRQTELVYRPLLLVDDTLGQCLDGIHDVYFKEHSTNASEEGGDPRNSGDFMSSLFGSALGGDMGGLMNMVGSLFGGFEDS